MENIEAKQVIDRLGGTSKVAALCDIKPPSVSDWKKHGIPKPWRKFLLSAHPEAFQPAGQPGQESAAA
ncbi:MAG: hypothetical protein ROZ09_15120 [Thiobacillus sp.]|jgi:hypothetical protein|uniref:hypothetical protein n=1 Tax=Thiobacillus sp. TaxID=924 RepID=UPI00289428C6|nr:hypothetical protein [Thiobacillus sp.]MDT3708152.1 hypothetical protein [Thiobacillus sp.]